MDFTLFTYFSNKLTPSNEIPEKNKQTNDFGGLVWI